MLIDGVNQDSKGRDFFTTNENTFLENLKTNGSLKFLNKIIKDEQNFKVFISNIAEEHKFTLFDSIRAITVLLEANSRLSTSQTFHP